MSSKPTFLLTCASALLLLACTASSGLEEADGTSNDEHQFGDSSETGSADSKEPSRSSPHGIEIPFTSHESNPTEAAWEYGCVQTGYEAPWLEAAFSCPCDSGSFGIPVVEGWAGTLDLSLHKGAMCSLVFSAEAKDFGEATVLLKGPSNPDAPAVNQSPALNLLQYYDQEGEKVSIPLHDFDGPNHSGEHISWEAVEQVIFDVWECEESIAMSIAFPLMIECPGDDTNR